MADADDRWQLLLFPESTSSVSGQVDTLFWAMVVACGLVVALVFTVLLVFGIRYRRGSPASRRGSPLLYHNRWLEIGWSIPVLAAFLFFFAWGALLYVEILDPPTPEDGDARRVNVIGKQWMWKFQHPEGIREINTLHVAVGQTVRLRMTSQDVIHSFFVPAFRIKQDVLPQTYTRLQFTPTKVGRFDLYCAEYCGLSHSGMVGEVVVMPPSEFQDWLARRDRPGTPQQDGLYGKPVPLESGGTVTADAQYLRDSIVFPSKHVVAGYAPIMPSFKDQISEEDLLKLTAYIQSLTPEEPDAP